MEQPSEINRATDRLYRAGQRVPPGIYRQTDNNHEVHLAHEDTLPMSLDGRVECYQRVGDSWGQMPTPND